MTYTISNVDYENQTCHFIVDKQHVISKRNCAEHVKGMKMNGKSFRIMPGQVYYDSSFFDMTSHTEKKKHYIELQKKGVTTIVVSYKLPRTFNLKFHLKKAKHELINSSLDFLIGITVQIDQLTPELLRECTRLKVPFIMIEMDYPFFLTGVIWEWIRDEITCRSPRLMPEWTNQRQEPKMIKKQNQIWLEFANALHIPTTTHLMAGPLNRTQLKAIGVYPLKGTLNSGSELDYNLFYKNQVPIVEDEVNTHYHRDIPNIVVLRGKLLKVDDTIYFRPGFGREVKGVFPGRFIEFAK